MKRWLKYSSLLFLLLINGCATSLVRTVWKADYVYLRQKQYDRILVAAVAGQDDTSFRRTIENNLAAELNEYGFDTITATRYYGTSEFREMNQEQSYQQLCESGIDAVLTIALIDRNKEGNNNIAPYNVSPSVFYYKRIWNYSAITAEPGVFDANPDRYYFECILFDLSLLQPQCVMQLSAAQVVSAPTDGGWSKKIIQHMKKEKILYRQKSNEQNNSKAF